MSANEPPLWADEVRGPSSRIAAFALGCALAAHLGFLGLVVLKLGARPTPPAPAVEDAPVVSLFRIASVASSAQPAPSRDPAQPEPPASQASLAKTPSPPVPTPAPPQTQILPKAEDEAALTLAVQALASAPDLASEPKPLHGEAKPLPEGGTSSAPSPAPDCQIAQIIQQDIQGSQTLLVALSHLPRQARSVANAVMLWDGAWVATAPGEGAASLEAVRGELAKVIRASPEACHTQSVTGPQFIPVVDNTGATILVIGSGVWVWADLLR